MMAAHRLLATTSHWVVDRVEVVTAAVVVSLGATEAAGATNNHPNMEEVTTTSLQATTPPLHRATVSRASTVKVEVRHAFIFLMCRLCVCFCFLFLWNEVDNWQRTKLSSSITGSAPLLEKLSKGSHCLNSLRIRRWKPTIEHRGWRVWWSRWRIRSRQPRWQGPWGIRRSWWWRIWSRVWQRWPRCTQRARRHGVSVIKQWCTVMHVNVFLTSS